MWEESYSAVIEPHRGLFSFDWREFWRYRELLYTIVWRDIKVRYKQTYLGASWAVFQPFVSMVVFTLFFGVLVKVPSDNLPYPIFVYAGLLPWTLFSNGLSRASMSLLNDANMISKIYFPRLIVPISSFGAGIVDFAISFLILIAMMLYYGVKPTLGILLFPLLIFITLIASAGVGVILAALTVAYRDVKYISPFLVQIWMYATPVIYPVSIVPEKWRWVLSLNPISGVIDGCRSALFGKPFDWVAVSLSTLISLVSLIIGLLYFKKAEYRFADII
jgi:lipopolysaccharide transport system permease protein